MTKFSAKYLNGNKAVKAIIFSKDKRIKTYYCIPQNKTITIGTNSFVINDDDFFLSDGFPTYIYNDISSEPVNPNKLNNKTFMKPDDFNAAISSKVAREIFDAASNKMDAGGLGLIFSGITLAAVAILAYIGYSNFESMLAIINEIRDGLASLGVV